MKKLITILFCLILSVKVVSQAIIADHTKAKLEPITEASILNAKANLHIAYGHTSHGSQILTGMTNLIGKTNLIGYKGDIYRWSDGVSAGKLDIDDNFVSGDLADPDRTSWESRTRTYLSDPANSDVNVVIWSWCSQVSSATDADIVTYLNLMQGLENDYPNIKFVYMTGHVDGTGVTGNLNVRNEQIRTFCKNNNKILYDFADIESYDPDGNYYLNKGTNDTCGYDSNADGVWDKNWAIDWQNSHTVDIYWYKCNPNHTKALNGNLKAYAAWWLWAQLGELISSPTLSVNPSSLNVNASANSTGTFSITATGAWTASSNQTWLTISSSSGSGNKTITVTATANPAASNRTATVTVTSNGVNKTVTITQLAATLTANPATLNVNAAANSTGSITVASSGAWTASSNQTWLTVGSASGSGNKTITITATANPAASNRTATVTISGSGINRTVTVTQLAATLTVNPSTITINAPANSTGTINISSTTAWTASSNQSWLTVNPASGNNNGTITLTAALNSSTLTRSATVTVSGAGINRTITVSQAASSPSYTENLKNTEKIFPNPFKNRICIEMEKEIKQISLYSLDGNLIIAKDIQNRKADLDLSQLASGVYIFRIHTENNIVDKKIIKEE